MASIRKYGLPTSRLIYPKVVSSAQIRELAKDPIHLLIWYTLLHGVDDQGRMEARISQIQANCLGHLPENAISPETVKAALQRMRRLTDDQDIPLIYIYPANGTKVLQLAKWWEHQGGMKNAWPSRWDAMPGWVDDIRGHGIASLREIIAEKNGHNSDPAGDPAGDGLVSRSVPLKRKQKQKQKQESTSVDSGAKPWDLFQAFLDARGFSYKDYPGPRVQLGHAKRMLEDGFTVEDVKAACLALSKDEYWAAKGFDLTTIHANYGKLKVRDAAKPKERPFRSAAEVDGGGYS